MRSRKFAYSVIGACLLALGLSQGAQAQITAAQQSAIKSSCRSDYMSNCMGVKPGGIEALQCLQKNTAKLSPGCQAAVSAASPQPAAAAAPSAPPPPAAAAAAPPPPAPPKAAASAPAITAAKPPAASIARPKPAAAMPVAPPKQAAVPPPAPPAADAPPAPTAAQLSAVKNTCRRDFTRNCKGIAPGTADAIVCLQRNAAKLSPNCQTSIADLGDSMPAADAAGPATQRPNAPVIMTAVIGRACLRDLVRRCRNTGVGDGQKIACLMAHQADLAPLCKAALKGTASIR
ncbi:MAG: cysteine rich repeat-containing protein [Pseudolabrys sp.]|jgi:hypothetical protein